MIGRRLSKARKSECEGSLHELLLVKVKREFAKATPSSEDHRLELMLISVSANSGSSRADVQVPASEEVTASAAFMQ